MNAPSPRTAAPLLSLLFLVIASFGPLADASPFSAKRVPAQADGVLHVDLEKLRASGMWKVMTNNLPDEARARLNKKLDAEAVKEWQSQGEEARQALTFSLLTRARSALVWTDGSEMAVVVLELPKKLNLLAMLAKARSLKSSIQNGIKVFHVEDETVVSLVGTTLIVGDHLGSVVTTAQLHQGKGKSLTGDSLGKLLTSRKDAIVAAGMRGKLLETLKASASSLPLPADIRSVHFFAGQKRKLYYGETELSVESADAATQLAGMMKGLLGLASIGNDDPTVAALLKGLTIKTQGAVVRARFELSEKLLTKIISQK